MSVSTSAIANHKAMAASRTQLRERKFARSQAFVSCGKANNKDLMFAIEEALAERRCGSDDDDYFEDSAEEVSVTDSESDSKDIPNALDIVFTEAEAEAEAEAKAKLALALECADMTTLILKQVVEHFVPPLYESLDGDVIPGSLKQADVDLIYEAMVQLFVFPSDRKWTFFDYTFCLWDEDFNRVELLPDSHCTHFHMVPLSLGCLTIWT